MTPIAINSLQKQPSYIFSSINENNTELFCNRLKQLKSHISEFEFINRAVQHLPSNKDLCSFNVIDVLKKFNHTIYNYSNVDPFPIISCVQELEKLEQKIQDHALGQLWDVLLGDSQLKTIAQKREWFEDENNQPLLDAVTRLKLSNCQIVRLPREIFRLRNLKKLDLSKNLIEALPESIKIWVHPHN